ncbi:MAG: inorganic phosphate transporter [Sulfolobales archaeon]
MDLAVIIGFAVMVYIAWCIGANDAANPTECAVGSGALNIRKALILFSIFVALGSLLQGWMVMKTFGGGIAEMRNIYDALIASLSTGIWITLASYFGMPISTTHSAVGSVMGVGLAYLLIYGSSNIKYDIIFKIVLSWITSPIGAILLSAFLYMILNKFYNYLNVMRISSDKIFRYLMVAGLIFSAYSFGANDVSNATGVYITFLRLSGSMVGGIDIGTALMLAAVGSFGIILGGFTVGHKVITTVAFKITRLDLVSGVAGEFANALVVWLFTTLPYVLFGYGIPISTTHASVSAVIGVGLIRGGLRSVDKSVIIRIIASWLLTVPLTAGLALSLRILTLIILSV